VNTALKCLYTQLSLNEFLNGIAFGNFGLIPQPRKPLGISADDNVSVLSKFLPLGYTGPALQKKESEANMLPLSQNPDPHLVLGLGLLRQFDAEQNHQFLNQRPQCNFEGTPIVKGAEQLRLVLSIVGHVPLCYWHSTSFDRRSPTRERLPLIGPDLLMLVDTLLHRALFFSKNMYEKRVSDDDRAANSQLIRKDHTAITAADEFRESWLNHVSSREGAGVAVAHGILLGTAPASASQRHSIQFFQR
jgi:hypothetical protein